MEYTSKEQLVEALRKQIANSDYQALKALIRVYDNQTKSEKKLQKTQVLNYVGFNGRDSKILSSLARQYNYKHTLSTKQIAIVKKLMPKYANQLIKQSIEQGKIRKENNAYVW